MRIERSDDVIARVEGLRADGAGGVLAFDGDGTLWSGDVGEDFLTAFFDHGDVREPARVALSSLSGVYGLATDGGGVDLGRRMFGAYAEGRFPETLMCEVTAWIGAGWTAAEITEFCRVLLERRGLLARLQRESIRVFEWARAEGIEVYVVSASPSFVVREAARLLGLAPDRIVALDPVERGGVLASDVARPIPYGPGKVEGLRARIGTRPIYAAFGDNVFDIPLLQDAMVPVAVRPKARLRDKASAVPDLVEMASE